MENPFDSIESYLRSIAQLSNRIEGGFAKLFLETKAEEYLIRKRIEAELEKIELQHEFEKDWDRSR